MSTFTLGHLREAKRQLDAIGRLPPRMEFIVQDAQQQARTPRDVKGPWVRPRCPSKRAGRKGTRRGWKRRNPPHHVMLYREPTDMLRFKDPMRGCIMVIVTPLQKYEIERATAERARERKESAVYSLLGNPW